MTPEGWTVKSGTDVSVKITKGASPKWQGFEYQDDGVLFVTSENVRDGFLDVSKPKFLPPSFSAKQRNSRLIAGDILINIVGASIGRSCRFDLEGRDANINQAVCLLRPMTSELGDYLFHYLQSPVAIDALLSQQSDSARPNLTLEDIRSFCFLLPPPPEQRRIAEILSTWDRAIETVETLIANARAQKKALMQSLLTGKHRLRGFSREWRSVCLGEIGKLRKGKGIQRDQVRDTGLPCIRYGEIYTQHHEQVRHFDSFIDAETAAESVPISAGDILFTCSGETAEEIGKCVAYLGSERAYAGGDIIILSPATDNAAFLSYVLNDTEVTEQKRRFGQGNSVVHISAANLARLTFTLPDRAEQDAIANILDDATGHIGGLEIELATLAQEKSALMQQLLTGKRRVKLTESEHF